MELSTFVPCLRASSVSFPCAFVSKALAPGELRSALATYANVVVDVFLFVIYTSFVYGIHTVWLTTVVTARAGSN